MLRVLNSLTPELDWRLVAAVCLVCVLAGVAVIARFWRAQSIGNLSDKGKLLELALKTAPVQFPDESAANQPGTARHQNLPA